MIPRVLFQGGSRSALKVSLPGFDVRIATLDQLAFNAEAASLAIIARGEQLMPSVGSGQISQLQISYEFQSRPPFGLCWFRAHNTFGQPFFTYANSPWRCVNPSGDDVNFGAAVISQSNVTFQVKFGTGGIFWIVGYVIFRQVD